MPFSRRMAIFLSFPPEALIVWAIINNSYCANLVVQNDGNVVIYSTTGAALWQTGTEGH